MSQPVPKASCGHPPAWAMSGVSKRQKWCRTAGCGWGFEDLRRRDIRLNGILRCSYNVMDMVNVVMFYLVPTFDTTNEFFSGDNRDILN